LRLADFNALCQDTWERGGGDILRLHLTPESQLELTQDVLLSDTPLVVRIDEKDVGKIRAGACISNVVNPITRTTVKIISDASRDAIEIFQIVRIADEYPDLHCVHRRQRPQPP
jgi:hypothetical protein